AVDADGFDGASPIAASLTGPACDPIASGGGARGQWLDRWLATAGSMAGDATSCRRIEACAELPHWPERFAGTGEDALELRATVLLAGARLAGETRIFVVEPELGARLKRAQLAEVEVLESATLTRGAIEKVVMQVLDGPAL